MYHFLVKTSTKSIIGIFDTLKQAQDCILYLQENDLDSEFNDEINPDPSYYTHINYIIETWCGINKINSLVISS